MMLSVIHHRQSPLDSTYKEIAKEKKEFKIWILDRSLLIHLKHN
jgi:hypothetical protein